MRTLSSKATGASVGVYFADPDGNPLSLSCSEGYVREGLERSLEDGLRLEREQIEQLFRSRDADEGLHAFVEKRNPTFVGA